MSATAYRVVADTHQGYDPECERFTGFYTFRIRVDEYKILKDTPKGYWIESSYCEKTWVSDTSTKKFAHRRLEDAITAFQARKKAQVRILKARLFVAEHELELAKSAMVDNINSLSSSGIR